MRDGRFFAGVALPLVAALWLGLLLGVSFLAAPVKFQAASLALPVALDVGQVTFALFSKVEWALAIATLACFVAGRPGRLEGLILTAVLAILAAQAFWLLPVLDVRLEAVVAGTPSPPSSHHMIYIATAVAKALLLFMLGLAAYRSPVADRRNFSAPKPTTEILERR